MEQRPKKNDRGKSPEQSLLKSLGLLTGPHRPRLYLIVASSFLSGIAEAGTLYLIARVALALTQGDEDLDLPIITGPIALRIVILLTASLVVARFLLTALVVREQSRLFTDVLSEIRSQIVRSYLGASWTVQMSDRDGRLQELVGTFATQVAVQMSALSHFLVATCSTLALLGMAVLANVVATLVVAVAAVGLLVILRPLRAAAKRRSKRSSQAGLAYGTTVSEAASMAQEVHVFGVGQSIGDEVDRLGDHSRRAVLQTQRLAGMLPAIYQSAALLVVVGSVAAVHGSGATRLASLGAVMLIGVRTLSYGQMLQSSYQALHIGAPYVETMLEENGRYQRATPVHGSRPLERVENLEFEDVSFSYDGKRNALEHVSFAAGRGEVVGIIGPSGSGKSTLVQLLLRLRPPDSGRVLVNGADATEYGQDWARRVAFVPQDAHLFRGSVSDNVRFFRESVTDEAVRAACRLAYLHDEIQGWPDGYDTEVGERGRQLSGGQRQRLTIARALVGQPSLVVLDEPTSNLDVKSEAAIREALKVMAADALVFVVAHRLSTLDVCDRIMVIQEGVLCGFDEPQVLASSSQFYGEALRLSGLR